MAVTETVEHRTSKMKRAMKIILGATAAAGFAFIASVVISAFGIGYVESRSSSVWVISAINFCAFHHIRLFGSGAAAQTSVLWPITLWALIPAAALYMGGWLAYGSRGKRTLGGAWIAIPYVIILLILRSFAEVSSLQISLPQLGVKGIGFDPGLFDVVMKPGALSSVFHGVLFGAVFGALGSYGVRPLLCKSNGDASVCLSWIRGALYASFGGFLIFLILSLVFSGGMFSSDDNPLSERVRSYAAVTPAASGMAQSVSQGVTVSGRALTTLPAPGSKPKLVQSYSFGLTGASSDENERKSSGALVWLVVIIPAGMLTFGGFTASKSASIVRSKIINAAGFAVVYAVIMAAAAPFLRLAIFTSISVGGLAAKTSTTVATSIPATFLSSLLFAFIFGFIGASIHRPNANP